MERKIKIWILISILFLFITNIGYSISGFTCDTGCPGRCEMTGLYCVGYDPCCGYCSNDNGRNRIYCCERCVQEI